MKTIQLEAINTYFDIQCQLNVSNVKYLACIDMLLFLQAEVLDQIVGISVIRDEMVNSIYIFPICYICIV